MRVVLTPCIKICKLDPTTRECIGCGRSITDIKNWPIYSDEQKKDIIKKLGESHGMGRNSRSSF